MDRILSEVVFLNIRAQGPGLLVTGYGTQDMLMIVGRGSDPYQNIIPPLPLLRNVKQSEIL